MVRADSWHLAEGDAITPELTAMRLLGGGSAYEAYLAFDELTYGARRGQGGPARPGRRRAQPARPAPRGRGAGPCQPPGRGPRPASRLDGERPHVVLEHLDGPRLSTLIRRHGPLQEQQYLPLAIDVASALHYLRPVDWTHLDIKPSNVIMGAPARLIDLSVARPRRSCGGAAGGDRHRSVHGARAVPPPRTGVPGHASDVWGLGATLFEAVAGYRAFDDGDRSSDDLEERYPQLSRPPHELPPGAPCRGGQGADRGPGPGSRRPAAPARGRGGARAGAGPPTPRHAGRHAGALTGSSTGQAREPVPHAAHGRDRCRRRTSGAGSRRTRRRRCEPGSKSKPHTWSSSCSRESTCPAFSMKISASANSRADRSTCRPSTVARRVRRSSRTPPASSTSSPRDAGGRPRCAAAAGPGRAARRSGTAWACSRPRRPRARRRCR